MKRHSQLGQALVLATLATLVLTGVVGLAIDMGYLRYTKRRLQTAADSAAIAAASELRGDFMGAARNDSKSNGFENGVDGVKVDVSNPPNDPPFAGSNYKSYVEVQVTQSAPTFFMRVFGVNSAPVGATATAYLASAKGCVYSLNLLGGIAVTATVNAPKCGVVDNSLLNLGGGGCLNAASIGVVLNLLGGGCATPPPVLGIAPVADPLGYLVAPGGGGCIADPRVNVPNPNTVTNVPKGVYCGITVQPRNNGQVNFAPGLYVVNGDLVINGAGPVAGDGVTFYVTGQVQIGGTGAVNLTAPGAAPDPGIPAGILFFQARGDGAPANITNGGVVLTGALYFPNAPLTLNGNGGTEYLIIVADTINFTGDVNIGTNYTGLTGGSPVKSAVLVQ